MRNRSMIVIVFIIAWSLSATAAIPESERIPVTDPAVLESMGLPADSTGIAVWVHENNSSPDIEAPDGYGTTDDHYAILGTAFVSDSDFNRVQTAGSSIACRDGATYSHTGAQLQLPDGAKVKGIRWWVYDAHASENIAASFREVCQNDHTASEPDDTSIVLLQAVSTGSAGHYSTWSEINPDVTIDNTSCAYSLSVRLGDTTHCKGYDLRLQKARVTWARQVSPAPGTATFNDVGTGHWAFQYIEALASSGITSGCGGSSFCPDNTLTRAEMAIFLSKALGLFWNEDNH